MKIEKILRIEPANDSIYPEILFRVQFSFPRFLEIPNLINGIVYCNQSRIGILTPYYNIHTRQSSTKLPLLSEDSVRAFVKKQNAEWQIETLLQEFSFRLDKNAIDFIESVREKDREKCARFQINFEINYFSFSVNNQVESGVNPSNTRPILELSANVQYEVESINIPQSDWVGKFSPALGIGNFLILELEKPDHKLENKDWKESLERAFILIKEMENELRETRWEQVIKLSREVWDLFKIYNNDKETKELFSDLFQNCNYSDDGIDDFIKSIWHVHEFASKFIHAKPKKGSPDKKLNPKPIPQREDAQFVFNWTFSLVNLLARKSNTLSKK